MIYLNNSLGGYAPYFSKAGILTSSINKTIFFPAGGPNKSLRFFMNLSLSMNKSSKFLELVYAEKLSMENTYFSLLTLNRYSYMITDLPTPVSPVISTLYPPSINLSRRYLNLTVSYVGTRILKYGRVASYLKSVTKSFHGLNSFLA